jgi:hypothetical protein
MPNENNNNIEQDVELSKELGLKEALGIAVGALIGGGVFSVLKLSRRNGYQVLLVFSFGLVIAFLWVSML